MMKPLIAAYILLATLVISSRSSKTLRRISNARVDIPDRKSKLSFFERDYDVAPDLLNDGKFAIAIYAFNSSDIQSGLSMQLVGGDEIIEGKCFLPMQLATSVTTWPVRRLSYKTALLAVEAAGDDHQQGRLKLVTVNFLNCKHEELYDVAMPEDLYSFTGSDNPSDERFSIIMAGKESCRGHNWCRLSFDPLYEKFQSLEFDFTLDQLISIAPATSSDEINFAVRLSDPITNTHKIRLYDLSTFKYKEVFSQGNTRMTLRFVDLMNCWTPEKLDKLKTIHCSKLQVDASVTFNHTLVFSDFMMLMYVKNIPNGFVVFSRAKDCYDRRECDIVDSAVVTRKFECIDEKNHCSGNTADSKSTSLIGNELIQIKYRRSKLECFALAVEAMNVRISETDGSVEVEYLCASIMHVSYHTFTVI